MSHPTRRGNTETMPADQHAPLTLPLPKDLYMGYGAEPPATPGHQIVDLLGDISVDSSVDTEQNFPSRCRVSFFDSLAQCGSFIHSTKLAARSPRADGGGR